MASIQCAIELYDGVSPVLQNMAEALDGFSGRLTQFGEEMAVLQPDIGGLAKLNDALRELKAEASGTYGIVGALLGASERILGVFSADVFRPFTDGASVSAAEVRGHFDEMGVQVTGTFDRMGRDIAATATGLPRHFTGPLGQISSMFASTAASARASMNSITNSARVAQNAVAAVNHQVRQQAVPSTISTASASMVSQQAVITPFSATGASMELLAMPGREALSLPTPEVYLGRESPQAAPLSAMTVTVHNENHIASELDVEIVLREMELRLADAVASSVEGVYA